MSRVPKRSLNNGGAIKWRDMEGEQYIPLSKLDDAKQADFPATCGRCERPYRKGDWTFRDEEGRICGVNCCATVLDTRASDDPLVDLESEVEGRDFVPLSQVLPTGKSKKDMCARCFQIPSSNGVCGC